MLSRLTNPLHKTVMHHCYRAFLRQTPRYLWDLMKLSNLRSYSSHFGSSWPPRRVYIDLVTFDHLRRKGASQMYSWIRDMYSCTCIWTRARPFSRTCLAIIRMLPWFWRMGEKLPSRVIGCLTVGPEWWHASFIHRGSLSKSRMPLVHSRCFARS